MGLDAKQIRVFLSSTFEDLKEERRTAGLSIRECEKTCREVRAGLSVVDLLTEADPSPPKVKCLSEVRDSHIFIGIMGTRYGSIDPETGKSISHLEYDEAGKCGIPILFYRSRKENIEYKEDVAAYTKKQEFEALIMRDHTIAKFERPDELRGHIIRDLPAEVFKISNSSSGTRTDQAPQTIEAIPRKGAKEIEKGPVGSRQIKELIQVMSKNHDNLPKIGEGMITRLFLLGNALFREGVVSGILGSHEVQRIYRERENVSLILSERRLILRTVLADEYGTCAGWFWFNRLATDKLRKYLIYASLNDREDSVKIQSIKMMGWLLGTRVDKELMILASHDSQKVSVTAIETLKKRGAERFVGFFETLLGHSSEETRDAAKRAFLTGLEICDPIKGLRFATSEQGALSKGLPFDLTRLTKRIGDDELKTIYERSDGRLKETITKELIQRGKLTTSELEQIIESENTSLRKDAYLALIEIGREFEPEQIHSKWPKATTGLFSYLGMEEPGIEDVITKIFEKMDNTKLGGFIQCDSSDSELAYYVMMKRNFSSMKEQLRQDMEDRFARILQGGSISKLKLEVGELVVEKVWEKISQKNREESTTPGSPNQKWTLRDWEEFKINQFEQAGLKVLLENGEPDDIKYAVRYMETSHPLIKDIAERLFIKLATAQDKQRLHEIIITGKSVTKMEAVEKMMALDTDGAAIEKLIDLGDSDITRKCLKADISKKRLLESGKFSDLLFQGNEDVRLLCVAYLTRVIKRKPVEAILNEYLKHERYFYNVVCWLDRILYAPLIIRRAFQKELDRHLGILP